MYVSTYETYTVYYTMTIMAQEYKLWSPFTLLAHFLLTNLDLMWVNLDLMWVNFDLMSEFRFDVSEFRFDVSEFRFGVSNFYLMWAILIWCEQI